MKPSIGRIVHYVDRNYDSTACRAAIITEVYDFNSENPTVALTVFHKHYENPMDRVVYDEKKGLNTWHWPERVDD